MRLDADSPLIHILFILMLAVSLSAGIRGIDFGKHWDEDRVTFSIAQSLETGLMIPRWYNYPSMTYELAMLSLVPELIRYHSALRFSPAFFREPESKTTPTAIADHTRKEHLLRKAAASDRFKLRVRCVFLVISLLSAVWTYLLVWFWRQNLLEALLASSLLGLSWEVGYHARWIAPDAILMQFSTLAIMFVVFAFNRPGFTCRRRSFFLAAGCAGLASGTKYPAGLLLLPVFLAACLLCTEGRFSFRSIPWRVLVRMAAIFVVFYLLTTPGTLVEPYEFLHDVRFEIRHYKSGHWGHTVNAGFEHGMLMLAYLSMEAFSPYRPISLFFFALVLVGAFSLIRREGPASAVFLSFPLCYFVFMSLQKVMIARNLLVILPFLAVLGARGFFFLNESYLKNHVFYRVVDGMVVLFLLINAAWLHSAADTIVRRGEANDSKGLVEHLENQKGKRFIFSPKVAELLSSRNYKYPMPGKDVADGEAGVIFRASETSLEPAAWPANMPGRYTLLPTGPYEVNFDYYPDWIGYDRIVILPEAEARKLGIAFLTTPETGP